MSKPLGPTVPTRLCNRCKTEKPRTPEHWHRDKSRPDGLAYSCKDCARARVSAWDARKRKAEGRPPPRPIKRRRTQSQRPKVSPKVLALFRTACTAMSLQRSIDHTRKDARALVAEVTCLVAIAICHSAKGVHRAEFQIAPEAFEIALRDAQGDSETLVERRCAPSGPETPGQPIVRYSAPQASPEAMDLHASFGHARALPEGATIDRAVAIEASLLTTTIRSRCDRLGLPALCTSGTQNLANAQHEWARETEQRLLALACQSQRYEWLAHYARHMGDTDDDALAAFEESLMAA